MRIEIDTRWMERSKFYRSCVNDITSATSTLGRRPESERVVRDMKNMLARAVRRKYAFEDFIGGKPSRLYGLPQVLEDALDSGWGRVTTAKTAGPWAATIIRPLYDAPVSKQEEELRECLTRWLRDVGFLGSPSFGKRRVSRTDQEWKIRIELT